MRISFLSNSRTTYGSHQLRLRWTLSLLLVDRRPWGWVSNCFWMTSGTDVPSGRASPRPINNQMVRERFQSRGSAGVPEKIRMVSIPVLNCDPPGGLGVVGREGVGVADPERTPLSLPSLGSEMRMNVY